MRVLIGLYLLLFFLSAFLSVSAVTDEKPLKQKVQLKKLLQLNESSADDKFFFAFPSSSITDTKGNIYLIDRNKLIKLDDKGNFISETGRPGQGPGDIIRPVAITMDDKNETIYLADQSNRKIVLFTTGGEFIREIKCPLGQPLNLAVDSGQNIIIRFMAPHDNFLLHRFSSDGVYLRGMVKKQFSDEDKYLENFKNFLFFLTAPSGDLLLAYHRYNVIQRIKPDGAIGNHWRLNINYIPREPHFISPTPNQLVMQADAVTAGITQDKFNNLFILWGTGGDDKGQRIDIYDKNDVWLEYIYTGVLSRDNSQEIYIDKINSRLIVLSRTERPALTVYDLSWR